MNNTILRKLSRSNRTSKLAILILSDFFMGLIAWIIFGPPLVNAVATGFEVTILNTVFHSSGTFLYLMLSHFIHAP